MNQILRKVGVILLAAGLGTVLNRPVQSASEAAAPTLERGGQTVKHLEKVQVLLTSDKAKVSLQDVLTMDVAIRNDGESPVYVYRTQKWGFMGGLLLHIRDEKGNLVKSPFLEDALPEPPPPDDPTIFIRLDQEAFYGTRTKRWVKDMVSRPGRYTLQVEYWSPLPREYVDIKLRSLPALWHEDPGVLSNKVAFRVVP